MDPITKSGIEFKVENSGIEGIKDLETDIFPRHFFGMIIGKPGSGKTSLIKFILQNHKLFYKKFDYVFITTRTPRQFKGLFLPEANFINELNWEWIKNILKNHNDSKKYINILFLFDDVVSDIYTNKNQKEIIDFFFNRRHLLSNGMVSIIVTTQKYRTIPNTLRVTCNFIVIFKLARPELKAVKEEVIFDVPEFNKSYKLIFKRDKDIDSKHKFLVYNIDSDSYFFNFDKINFKTN